MANPYFISATFWTRFFGSFQALMMKKLRCKYYNKCITTRDDVNVQSPNQEESKLNSTINANIGAHAHVKIIKNPFSKNKISYY